MNRLSASESVLRGAVNTPEQPVNTPWEWEWSLWPTNGAAIRLEQAIVPLVVLPSSASKTLSWYAIASPQSKMAPLGGCRIVITGLLLPAAIGKSATDWLP